MGMLKLDAVVHWSIPVNNLKESENSTARFSAGTSRAIGQFADVLLQTRQPQHSTL
jgi:hypothetical protein